MTASSSKPNPALEWLKERVHRPDFVETFPEIQRDTLETNEDWIALLNTMPKEALGSVLNNLISVETAVAFLRIIDRKLPTPFVKNHFIDIEFINVYCAQGYALCGWMLTKCELQQLAILYVNRSAFCEQEAESIAKAYKTADQAQRDMCKQYKSQKDLEKLVKRSINNQNGVKEVQFCGLLVNIVSLVMVLAILFSMETTINTMVKQLATIDKHVDEAHRVMVGWPLGDYLRQLFDSMLKLFGM
ncbi:MAG: hypothetical protein CMP20_01815 [Rickettsiales bacterium]|nr:hypothetical protein [Rickettsiales bacterium]